MTQPRGGAATTDAPPLRRNSLANIAARGVSLVAWVLVTPFVLHHLGTDRFGVWALLFVLTGSAAVLDLGLGPALSRYVAVARARAEREVAAHLVRRGLAGAVLLGIGWAIACLLLRGVFVRVFHVPPAFVGEVRAALVVFAAGLMVMSISGVLQGALAGFQRIDFSNAAFLSGLSVQLAVLVIGLARGGGLMSATTATLAGQVAAAVVGGVLVRHELGRLPHGGGTPPELRELAGFGAAVQVSNVLNVAQMQAGKVLLGMLGTLGAVTAYELGFRLVNAVWSLPILIQAPLIPAAAHVAAVGGQAAIEELYRWTCRWAFALGAWALGGLVVIAPMLLRAWMGSVPDGAPQVARLLAVAFAVGLVAAPATALARGRGWPWLEGLYFAVALAVQLAAGAVLVPARGVLGAGWAALASFLIAGVVVVPILHRRIQLSTAAWLRAAGGRFVPAAVAAAAVLPLAVRVPPGARAASLVQAAALFALFTTIHLVLTWPTGDIPALWGRGRAWWTALRPGAFGERA